jgi:flagellum-specific ATP synthase
VVLSRQLAHQGRFPAIDVLQSASRLFRELSTPAERELVDEARRLLALLERNRQIVEIGAYQAGSNPALDRALEMAPALDGWLRQRVDETASRTEAYAALRALLSNERAAQS